MLKYAEKERLTTQSGRTLTSSFKLTNALIIHPTLLFYLELRLVCAKVSRFVEYTPIKRFDNIVQFVVNARRQGDENPNFTVVSETMKLLINSLYGYQIMDRSHPSVTRYMNDEKTHAAINHIMFKRLKHISDQFCDVELAMSGIENEEPINVGLFILQYSELRMWELYYNFFQKVCNTDKYEEIEIDTDSSYSALAEKELFNCIGDEKSQECDLLSSEDCNDSFTSDGCSNFFLRKCYAEYKKHDKRDPGLFEEEFRCTEIFCLCNKTYCCYDSLSSKVELGSKGLNKRTFEDSRDGSMAKYQKTVDGTEKVTSTNRGFHSKNHCISIYDRTKKDFLFCSKRMLSQMESNLFQ